MPQTLEVDVYDGKYTVRFDETGFRALRYGEDWRDLTGDNLVLQLAYEVESLRSRLGLDTKTGQPKELCNAPSDIVPAASATPAHNSACRPSQ